MAEPATEFITLRDGPTLPLPAVLLALDLEFRGFVLRLDDDLQLVIERTSNTGELAEISEAEHAAICRWRWHIAALVAYQPPEPR